jgi:uncharacterized membrane protein
MNPIHPSASNSASVAVRSCGGSGDFFVRYSSDSVADDRVLDHRSGLEWGVSNPRISSSALLPLILLILAAGFAGWSVWWKSNGNFAGCPVTGAICSGLLTSRFGSFAGVPVGSIGAAVYLVSALAMFATICRPTASSISWVAWMGSWTILFAGGWFGIVQAIVIRAFCPWCVSVHLLASAGAALFLLRDRADGGRTMRLLSPLMSLLVVSMFTGLQLRASEPSHRFIDSASIPLLSLDSDGKISVALPAGGGGLVNPARFPSLGFAKISDKAIQRKPILISTDWTCPNCRELHSRCRSYLLKSESVGDVGFLLLPAWRDEKALAIHRLMLAAWLEDRSSFEQAATLLIKGILPASPESTGDWLKDYFGKDAWPKIQTKHDAEISQILGAGALILSSNDARAEVSILPQLVSNAGLIQGLPSYQALEEFVRNTELAGFEPSTPRPIEVGGWSDHTNGNSSIGAPSPSAEVVKTKAIFERVHDVPVVGPIASETSEKGVITFRNSGSETLTILGVYPSCGCTAIDDWRQTIAPGDIGRIHFTFDAHNIPIGSHPRSITIRSNAANTPPDGHSQVIFTVQVVAAGGGNSRDDAP